MNFIEHKNTLAKSLKGNRRMLLYLAIAAAALYWAQHQEAVDQWVKALYEKSTPAATTPATGSSSKAATPELGDDIASLNRKLKLRIDKAVDTGEKWQLVILLPKDYGKDPQSRDLLGYVRSQEFWSYLTYRMPKVELPVDSAAFSSTWLDIAPDVAKGYPGVVISADNKMVFKETGPYLEPSHMPDRILAALETHRSERK